MRPIFHIIYGLLFCSTLFYFFEFTIFPLSIIFLSSVLIDIDHYIYYVFKKRDINLINAYNHFIISSRRFNKLSHSEKKKFKRPIMFLHGIESLLVLFILSIFLDFFLWILIGFLFHLFLDYIHLIYIKLPISMKTSQLFVYFRNKKKIEFEVNEL